MKRTLNLFNRPVPMWLFALWLAGGMSVAALAAVPLYTGSLSVPAAGAVTLNQLSASACTSTTAGKVLESSSHCVSSITGTANRVTASAATGAITLNGPQDICTTCSPTFASPNFTGTLTVPIITGNDGGGRVQIYGSSAGVRFTNAANTSNNLLVTDAGVATVRSSLTAVGLSASTGPVQGASDGAMTSYVGPAYTNAGAVVASTYHHSTGVVSWVISGTCLINTQCTLASGGTLALSGAAVFASATSYACSFGQTSTSDLIFSVNPTSTSSSVLLDLYNTNGSISGTKTVYADCVGT